MNGDKASASGGGHAPYVAYATEAEQRGFDATARKLLRLMLTTTPGA